MKFNRCMLVYNEKPLLRGGVKSWSKVGKHPLVLLSSTPWHGDGVDDGSEAECHKLGCMVVKHNWREEHKQRNAGMKLSRECDYVIWNDPDTWIESEQLDNLIKEVKETRKDAYCITQRTYWHDLDHILVDDKHTPIVCVKPHVPFYINACVDTDFDTIESAFVHHLSWCEPKNILGKLKTYSHAPELKDVDLWYDKHFKNWHEGQPAVMPDGKIFEVAYSPLPQELRAYLDVDA